MHLESPARALPQKTNNGSQTAAPRPLEEGSLASRIALFKSRSLLLKSDWDLLMAQEAAAHQQLCSIKTSLLSLAQQGLRGYFSSREIARSSLCDLQKISWELHSPQRKARFGAINSRAQTLAQEESLLREECMHAFRMLDADGSSDPYVIQISCANILLGMEDPLALDERAGKNCFHSSEAYAPQKAAQALSLLKQATETSPIHFFKFYGLAVKAAHALGD